MNIRRVDVEDGINVILDERFCAIFSKESSSQVDWLIECIGLITEENDPEDLKD